MSASSTTSHAGPDGGAEVRVEKRSINWVTLVGSATVVVALAAWSLLDPMGAGGRIGDVVGYVIEGLGWWYFLLAAALVVFVLYVCCSRLGRIRLGPEESRPQYSLFTWTAMLFAAGIGTDVMFYSVAEPVAQYLAPPQGGGETREAAEQAVVWTLFHYGVSGWAMYAVLGMALGFFAYRKGMPLSIRSALYPIFGKRIQGRAGDVVDLAAILGTVFGIATSLGIGIVQLSYGLHLLFGVSDGRGTQVGLIVVSVVLATVSAVSGIDKGIRRISELNVLLTLGIMAFVLFVGDTSFLLNGLVMNLGDYLTRLPGMSTDTMAYDQPTDWLSIWTLFFWAWWVAWAPFVGLFLARVSRGRTIRQFLVGVLAIPFTFILLWMSVMGNSVVQVIREGNVALGQVAYASPQKGFYSFLETLPAPTVLIFVATLTGFLYYVTSADSGALVLGNFSSRLSDAQADCHWGLRIFWSIVIGLLTVGMLFAGDDGSITTLTNATIIMGLPFSVVLALVAWGLLRSLRAEALKDEAFVRSLPASLSVGRAGRSAGRGPERHDVSVAQRVSRMLSFPDEDEMAAFIDGPVAEGLDCVAHELSGQGESVEVRVDDSDGMAGRVLEVSHAGNVVFAYAVRPVLVPAADFTGRPMRATDRYYRAEVFLIEGAQGYCLNGYSAQQVAEDALDQLARHLTYLHSLEHDA